MKKSSKIVFSTAILIVILLFNLMPNVSAMALNNTYIERVPQKIAVTVEDKVLNHVGYSNFTIDAKKIDTNIGVAYCLEIEKDYPDGHNYIFEGKPSAEIIGVMAGGYPQKSAAELGLSNDDDAYFATQIAVWCVTEGYNPKKFKSDDNAMLNAIKSIYENRLKYNEGNLDYLTLEYYYSDSMQRIAVYVNKLGEDANLPTGPAEDLIIPEEPVRPPMGPALEPVLPEESEVPEDGVIEEGTEDKNIVPGLG